MVIEFLVPFVEAISRREERNRIRNVNGNRHIQLAARVPHRVETRVIDSYQFAGCDVLSQIETERLQDLQAFASCAVCTFDGVRLNTRIIRLKKFLITGFGEAEETARIRLIIFRDHLRESVIVSTSQI